MTPSNLKKTCPSCRKLLSLAAFNGSARSTDGLANRCRACINVRRRQLDAGRRRRPAPENLAAMLRHGDVARMRRRLRAGAQPHWNWICECMRGGHLALARMLVDAGAERNLFAMAALGDVPAVAARARRAPADVRSTADFEPNCRGATPLHVACAADWRIHGADAMAAQVEVAALLHQHGADLNATARYRGIDEATPLFCACWSSGNLALVRWLLEHGAVALDRDLLAALGHFQRHGKACCAIAEALLAWGLPVDGGVPGARTPLQACAHQGNHKTVAWLIGHGANVNARGPGGRTAAHLAAERNTGPATLALLADNGADLHARDQDGRTPFDIAKLNQKGRVAEWLKRRQRRRGRP